VTATPEYRKAFSDFLAFGVQSRALSATSPADGGYLVAPITMATGLLKFLDNMVFIRQKATVYPALVQSASLGIVSLDSDPDDADWTSELGTGNEDSAMAFGKRELKPFPLAKRIKVSNKLLRQVSSAESIVQNRLGYKFGVTQEKAFLTGSGSNQPLGLFTASANGISTGRDVSTDNTSNAITADGLINAKYAVKEQYQRRGEWIFHRDAVRNIRKLKDSQNQYIWQPGLAGGQPDTLLDRPINQSEYAPNTFTTGLYVGIFGDLSFYHIADALTLTIQRLVELYAASNQTGYIARLETDGMPALEEAFARVKLA
jgi:HK97 family phage major capsid protein